MTKSIKIKTDNLEKPASVNHFEGLISPKQLAESVGLSYERIHQLSPALVAAGVGARVGKPFIFHISAIEFIKSIPDGRKKK